MSTTDEPALAGLRVIDLSTKFMGPYCSRLLSDLGADVIKVEAPGGDIVRHVGAARNPGMGAIFLTANHGKRSVALDLKNAEGRAALLRIVAGADVFLHNFRPAAIERLGLGADVIRNANPQIIYCALVGYGGSGPYRNQAAYDDVIQAASGLASVQGGDHEPGYVRAPIADKTVALAAVCAVGIPATPVVDVAGLFSDEHLHAVKFFDDVDHPTEGHLRYPQSPMGSAGAAPSALRPAPGLGEHSLEVLREAGMDAEELERLVAEGVIVSDGRCS